MSVLASYRDRPAYPAFVLGGIALLASGAIVFGHSHTHEAIAARRAEDLRASLAEVIPPHMYENDLIRDPVLVQADSGNDILAYRGRRDGEVTAVAWRLSVNGYAGPIELIVGVDRSGRVQGVRVLSHAETPGLGDRIETSRSDWIRTFDGLSLAHPVADDWAVKKDGGYFDAFTGATITPRAVVKAVKEALLLYQRRRSAFLDAKPTTAERTAQSAIEVACPADAAECAPDNAEQSRDETPPE